MALIKWQPRRTWDPFTDLMDLHTDINRLFRRSLSPERRQESPLWEPALDVYQDKDTVVVKADLPGMEKDDIQISVSDNVLEISGTRMKEEEVKEDNVHFVERIQGEFRRYVQLPTDVDASKVKASLKNGVLEVRLPESETAKPKKIPIDIK